LKSILRILILFHDSAVLYIYDNFYIRITDSAKCFTLLPRNIPRENSSPWAQKGVNMTVHTTCKPLRTLFSLLLLLCVAIFSMYGSAHAVFHGQRGDSPPSFADLADEVKHAVVNISTSRVVKGRPLQPVVPPDSPLRDFFGDDFFKRFFGGQPQGEMKTQALGSGFVIDTQGHILTNNHVIEKADEIKIKLENGKEYDAQVVGRDPKTDLALIKAPDDAELPKPVPLGDSEQLRVGDWIIAVGNPFGLGHTVTAGIISGKGRVIGAGPYDDFLQTDAAINPGNSGGPLYNMNGEVIGISTAIVAQGQGIGFAIPINVARQLLEQLKTGKVIRGWLGIAIQDVSADLAEALGLEKEGGVLVGDVLSGGPAEQSGLRRGDVIIRFNGREVENVQMFTRMVAATPPDTSVEVDVVRNGKVEAIPVSLGTMPEEVTASAPARDESLWGIKVGNLTPELSQQFGWKEDERGVVITEVDPGSPAGEAQLRAGDLIKEVNRQEIKDANEFRQAAREDRRTLLLLIKRGESTFYAVLKRQNGSPEGGS
jgi:serine protease Do